MPLCPQQRNQLQRLTSTLQFFPCGFLTVFVSSGACLELIEQSQFLMVWTCFLITVPRTCSILSLNEKKKKLNPNMTKLTSRVEWSWARKSQLHQRLKRFQVLDIKGHALFNLFACSGNTKCTIPSLKAKRVLTHKTLRFWWNYQTKQIKYKNKWRWVSWTQSLHYHLHSCAQLTHTHTLLKGVLHGMESQND